MLFPLTGCLGWVWPIAVPDLADELVNGVVLGPTV